MISVALACGLFAQNKKGGAPAPEFIREGQQLMRQGQREAALAVYERELAKTPDSIPALNASAIALEFMGRTKEARDRFEKAAELAPTPAAKNQQRRYVMMSYAFDGDCAGASRHVQPLIDYWTSVGDAYQQGEMANELARVCIDAGDLDVAEKWYRAGTKLGLTEKEISSDRRALWEFRLEHALARLAARRGNAREAEPHVARAKAILEANPEMAKQQQPFLPYLVGYVAYYRGDYRGAIEALQQANQNDAFIQTFLGEAYEKAGDKEKAMEMYRKASLTATPNPPGAYASRVTRAKLAGK
ncbi:MAG: tetratricopeptide repeat protein [Bryobacteraceae bacterium]|nr:tetratricopeptide repeat protein [Bryobacteraceae bacterium]